MQWNEPREILDLVVNMVLHNNTNLHDEALGALLSSPQLKPSLDELTSKRSTSRPLVALKRSLDVRQLQATEKSTLPSDGTSTSSHTMEDILDKLVPIWAAVIQLSLIKVRSYPSRHPHTHYHPCSICHRRHLHLHHRDHSCSVHNSLCS